MIQIKRNKVTKKRDTERRFMPNLQQATSSDNTTNRNIILDNSDLKIKGNSHWIIGEEDNGDSKKMLGIGSDGDVYLGIIDASTNGVRIRTDNQDRIYINNAGNIGIGTTNPRSKLDVADRVYVKVNVTPLTLDRTSTNGTLISLQQDGIQEGEIRVFGSTVSYLGFSGSHESSGISTGTPKGTVVSTIDSLDFKFKNGEIVDREDHPQTEVSNKVGDKRVYGVVDYFNGGKVIITSTGIGSILVTGPCEGGDLLESNGDGTARVQADDIVRSSTIAKVTISDQREEVKLVSCIMLQ